MKYCFYEILTHLFDSRSVQSPVLLLLVFSLIKEIFLALRLLGSFLLFSSLATVLNLRFRLDCIFRIQIFFFFGRLAFRLSIIVVVVGVVIVVVLLLLIVLIVVVVLRILTTSIIIHAVIILI